MQRKEPREFKDPMEALSKLNILPRIKKQVMVRFTDREQAAKA